MLERVDQEQVLGFYDDRAQRLAVIRDADAGRPLLELTLAHELVHALEDQRYGFDMPEGVRSDHVLAEAALAEGSATAVMADYAERTSGRRTCCRSPRPPKAQAFPEYIERQLLFPYIAGQEFVSVLRGESGGWDAVDSVYRLRRPRTTEQVIHPRKFAAGEAAAARVAVPDAVLPAPWRRLRSASVGEFDLQMLVERRAPRPARAAAGWGGGRFELWRRPRRVRRALLAADLAWIGLRWDTPTDRAEGEAALRTAVEKGGEARRPGCGRDRWADDCVGWARMTPRRSRRGGRRAARGDNRYADRCSCGTIAPGRLWGVAPRGGAPSGKSGQAAPGGRPPACSRYGPRRTREEGARAAGILCVPGPPRCMCRSSSATPDTRSSTDMTSGPAIAHHASPVASATAYSPHRRSRRSSWGGACSAHGHGP